MKKFGLPSASRCPQVPEPMPVVKMVLVGAPPAQLHPPMLVLVVELVVVVVVVPDGHG